MVLRLALYSSSLCVVLSLSLFTSHSVVGTQSILVLIAAFWWYSDYPFTHHSVPGGTQTIPIFITVYLVAQTIPILITVSLVVLRLSLYSSKSPWWYSDYLYTHHSLPSGTQTISILITVSLVVLRLSLYTSLSLWWYSDYPYTHHSLSGGTGISDGPLTYHSLPGGTQIIPILITVSLVVLRLSLWTSQSP